MSLTKRNKEILNLTESGLPINTIADRLTISSRTVESHRSGIMLKLGKH